MDSFEHRSLATKPLNLTYSYYVSPEFSSRLTKSSPTLLFIHGYPDDATMWAEALREFESLPYPIIAVDLLGFGGSSKPHDAPPYNYKQQANSIAQILDKEGVPNNVIPIGHDWGSATAQRFYLYHKERCIGLSLLSLAYQVPTSEPFSLESKNVATAKQFGYPQWEYWNFFTRDDAPKLMKENLDRFYEVNNGLYPSPDPEENGRDIWMREMFCKPGAMYEYMTKTGRYADYTVPLKPYRNLESKVAAFKARLSRDGLEGPVNYYHSLKNNTMLDDERELVSKEDGRKIEVPLLYIGQTGDWVCRTDLMKDAVNQGLVPGLEEKVVDAGHWVLYEKPEEIAAIIKEWLDRRFPVNV